MKMIMVENEIPAGLDCNGSIRVTVSADAQVSSATVLTDLCLSSPQRSYRSKMKIC